MKRRIYKDDACESDLEMKHGKPKYICPECDSIYCKKCYEAMDYICDAHQEPYLVPIT